MPIVPFSRSAPEGVRQKDEVVTPPPLPWALIAAAQMNSEGRLIEPKQDLDDDKPR